jgi:GTP-binding protein Era
MTSTSESHNTASDVPFRAGYVAMIGEPNVGKSTLMNGLVGQKISIVTNKPQTTRHKVLGILSRENFQIVFLDTPGLLVPKYALHESMMASARSAIADADVLLFMIDAAKIDVNADPLAEHAVEFNALAAVKCPVYLVINKVDVVARHKVASIIAVFAKTFAFEEVFPISALQSQNTDALLDSLVKELPEHPPFYPPDIVSEHSERFFVSEIIREKIFERFREEIPYSTTVDIVDFKEQKGRKDLINAEIYVERDSQKGILIGKHAHALKEIGELARKDIEAFLQRPVFLELHVKVRDRWRQKEVWLKRLGYGTQS